MEQSSCIQVHVSIQHLVNKNTRMQYATGHKIENMQQQHKIENELTVV